MGFFNVLSKIGHVLATGTMVAEKVVSTEAPLIGLINPLAGALITKVSTVIAGTEAIVTTAQAGALKKQSATQILENEIPNIQELIQQFGKNVSIPSAELSAVIDATVSQLNAFHAFIAALKGKGTAAPPVQTTGT